MSQKRKLWSFRVCLLSFFSKLYNGWQSFISCQHQVTKNRKPGFPHPTLPLYHMWKTAVTVVKKKEQDFVKNYERFCQASCDQTFCHVLLSASYTLLYLFSTCEKQPVIKKEQDFVMLPMIKRSDRFYFLGRFCLPFFKEASFLWWKIWLSDSLLYTYSISHIFYRKSNMYS